MIEQARFAKRQYLLQMIGLARAAVLLALFIALPSSAVATVVGSLQLTPCGSGRFCGSIDRPLDPRGRVRGHISIHFRYYPATHTRHAVGTIVTVEGGPGFSSIGSANAYLALFGPLRSTYNMLIVDTAEPGCLMRSTASRCSDRSCGNRQRLRDARAI